MKIRIGTRGSRLALAQTTDAQRRLEALGCETEVIIIKTSGDVSAEQPFAAIGAPGVFVREIETALIEGRIDVAVHSYKDLPTQGPEQLVIAAVPERVDPADVLLTLPEARDENAGRLPVRAGARIGTSSARRLALLSHWHSDVRPVPMRGNVPTRVRKLRENGEFDGILLAAAGLIRLSGGVDLQSDEHPLLNGLHVSRLDPATFVPAPSQGAIAYQVHRDRTEVRECIARLDAPEVRAPLRTERQLQTLVEGGCLLPVGAWCRPVGDELELTAFLQREEPRFVECHGTEPDVLARQAFERLEPDHGVTA